MNTWGTNINQSKGQKRDVPYMDFNNSPIKEFKPLEGNSNVQILAIGDWQDPFQVWEHRNSVNGVFEGVYFSRQNKYTDVCPFKQANEKQLAMNNGTAIKNADRVYPISARYWIMVRVDEAPEIPFMLYGISKTALESITNVFNVSNSNPMANKIIVSRIGSGIQTKYTYLLGGQAVPFQQQLPKIDKENFKEFFINLQTVDHIFSANGFAETEPQQENQNNFEQQAQAQSQNTFGQNVIGGGNAQEDPTNQNAFTKADEPAGNSMTNPQVGGGSAGDYVVQFGVHAGKKLSEIDPQIVKVFCDMDGEIQAKSSEYLNSIGA